MSRCFPFPPPGYVKKATPEDKDQLKKEKHRERKHKKEKKDKEKRDSKERKDKDRSNERHKEKKDKKEKNRDKKKDKERDSDKDKTSTSGEKRPPDESERHNGDKLEQKECRTKENSMPDETIVEKAESHNGVRPEQKEYRFKDNSMSNETKNVGKSADYYGDKPIPNSHLTGETKNSKLVPEEGRKIKDESNGTRKLLAEKITVSQPKSNEGMVKLVAKGSATFSEGKEKNMKIDDRRNHSQGNLKDTRYCGNVGFHNSIGMAKPLDKEADRTETKEKIKEKEGDDKRVHKHKDKERENSVQRKDKDKDRERKKEENPKEKAEQRSQELDKLKESNIHNLIHTHSIKIPQVPPEPNKGAAMEGNLKKRKDVQSNGVLHANDNRSGKLPRTTSGAHPFKENGRILEPCQASISSPSERPGVVNDIKLENKERGINGIIGAHPPASTKPPEQSAPPPMKSPHRDLKYLSQVYSVPQTEEWSIFDDQEWLFTSKDSETKKPKVESSEVEETPQVWAEAMQIDSANVCALPFVIPY